jgi:hypothetical protein
MLKFDKINIKVILLKYLDCYFAKPISFANPFQPIIPIQ